MGEEEHLRREMEDLQSGVAYLRKALLGKGSPERLADRTRSWLAIIVIVASLAMIAASLFVFGVDPTIKFSGVLTGIIGLVLGYYFGKQGLTKAQESLTAAQREVEEAKAIVSSVNAQRDATAAENRNLLEYRDLAANAEAIMEDHKKAMDFIRAQELEEEFKRV